VRARATAVLGLRAVGRSASSSASAASNVAVVVSERLARYGFGDGHPFGPDRHSAFVREFAARGLDRRVRVLEPRAATDEELRAFHSAQYLDFVRERSASGNGFLDGGDTPAFRGVYEAAAGVVGASLSAVEAIMQGECRRAFVPIAGLHHAARDRAAGFCVFNDCGVAIELLKRAGLTRIAYVDIDAHHGDGVFYAFEDDPAVVFADLHEDGRYLYPGTGAAHETGKGAAMGTKLNLPLPPGTDDQVFAQLWPHVTAHLEKFAPQFVILQCGADSLEGDPITHLRLTAESHGRAARELTALAERLGHGRVLALGGGGYNRHNLAQAWNTVVENLLQ
jgi:acetoin utilization protein AcuC